MQAVSLYQSACCHLSPLLHYQPSSVPASLAGAVAGYQRRSQQLSRQQPGDPGPAQTPVSQLLLLVRPGDKIQTGLEICQVFNCAAHPGLHCAAQAGEDYASQGSLQLALDKLTAGLGLLVPALQVQYSTVHSNAAITKFLPTVRATRDSQAPAAEHCGHSVHAAGGGGEAGAGGGGGGGGGVRNRPAELCPAVIS